MQLALCSYQGLFFRFRGVILKPVPPLPWLVAPDLRFHPATDILLKYLPPEMPITHFGPGENWRRGLRMIFRH